VATNAPPAASRLLRVLRRARRGRQNARAGAIFHAHVRYFKTASCVLLAHTAWLDGQIRTLWRIGVRILLCYAAYVPASTSHRRERCEQAAPRGKLPVAEERAAVRVRTRSYWHTRGTTSQRGDGIRPTEPISPPACAAGSGSYAVGVLRARRHRSVGNTAGVWLLLCLRTLGFAPSLISSHAAYPAARYRFSAATCHRSPNLDAPVAADYVFGRSTALYNPLFNTNATAYNHTVS